MAKSPKQPQDAGDSAKPAAPRTRIVEALMELAGERAFAEITITDIAAKAHVTLAEFRDCFPSKGAILAGWSRMIDSKVLEASSADLVGEPAKERLFDVLMRRLDAMAPYRAGVESVMHWVRRDPGAALALNQVAVNSMRFMLEAAGIDNEGPLGAVKTQGLVVAWTRIVTIWLADDKPGLDATMAALDKELTRGGQFVARAEDAGRLLAPLSQFARALCDARTNMGTRMRERGPGRGEGEAAV